MNYRLLSLEIGAILISYMIFMLPIALATNVNIMFNGQVQQTVQLDPESIVNKEISTEWDPGDITWSNVKVRVKINKASLAHTIKKIYLYKCKKMDPVQCVLSAPQSFDQWIDTELAWSDISEREGVATYPQVANLLILVKLEDVNARITWTGFRVVVKRLDYNVFDIHDEIELDQLNLHAESLEMVEPIKFFIESYRMVPFNWLTRAVFRAASALYAIGSDEAGLEQSPPVFEAGRPSGNEITAINRQYYFIFPNTTSGIAHPVPLNLNPSFVCGDDFCQSDLGETKENCCYDCGCQAGQYCDLSNATSKQGACKNESLINLEVTGYSVPQLSDCSGQYTINITARVNNPPSTLPSSIQGHLSINNTFYTVSCSGGVGGIYSCPLTLTPAVSCGAGSYSLGPNVLNTTVSYMDGPNSVTRDFSTAFPDMSVSYDCACSPGYYCEAGTKTCKPEGSISLGIINVGSYITYNATDNKIFVRARVNNPPADLGVTGSTYVLGNITYDSAFVSGSLPGASGSVTCSLIPYNVYNQSHVYDCELPFTIPSYNHSYRYVIRGNSLTFSVSYSNGALTVNKDLTSIFSDITIPSWHCGDGTCNPEEDSSTCCLDCKCLLPGQYCDRLQGCLYTTNITLAIDAVNPKNLTDCKIPHTIDITARIINPPTDLALNYYYYTLDSEVMGWGLQCTEASPGMNLGIFNCHLTIPPIDGCSLPYYTLGPNKLNFTTTFLNGTEGQIVKTLETDFDNIYITPIYHCRQYGCESELGESGSNCCIDCPCKDDPSFGPDYYCDYDPQLSPNGTCLAKSNITLVIDSPSAPVHIQSCEVPNIVNVKAHIENQPSGMFVESAFAILNDTTSSVWCQKEQLFPGANYSFNCSVRIAPIFECTQGQTYNYRNNSMSFFISYMNGIGRREGQSLTASFPEVVITQGIRTLYDIMQDAREKLLQKVDETMAIAEKLLEWMETCVKMAITLAIMSMVAMVAVPMMAKAGWLGETSWSDALTATSAGVMAINTIWGNICKMVSEWYNAQFQMKSMEMELIKMEWCTEFWQHQMDMGLCRGDEWNCFSSIINCADLGKLGTYMNNAMGSVTRIGSYTADTGRQFEKLGESWDQIWGTGRGTIMIYANRLGVPNGGSVCEYSGPVYKTTRNGTVVVSKCTDTTIKILVPSSTSCKRYIAVLDGDRIIEPGEHKARILLGMAYGSHSVGLYCDREPYGFFNSDKDKKIGDDITFTYLKANPLSHTPIEEACGCLVTATAPTTPTTPTYVIPTNTLPGPTQAKYGIGDHIELIGAGAYMTATITEVNAHPDYAEKYVYNIMLDSEYGGYEIHNLSESAIIGKIESQTATEFFDEKTILCENTYNGELCQYLGVECTGTKYYSYYWFSDEYGTQEFICCTKDKCESIV